MDKAASATLRRCLRTSSSSALRCQSSSGPSKCLATRICAARNVVTTANSTSASSTSATSISFRNRIQLKSRTLREYSTNLSGTSSAPPTSSPLTSSSPVEGTVGQGAPGIKEEISRAKEMLQAPDHLNEKEREVFVLLLNSLEPTSLEVQDISGGCGSMYGIDIVSEKFRGLGMLKQQRLVNEVLGEQIKGWHGVQLKTRAP